MIKNINGKEFLVGDASMLVANGSAMQVFGYLQKSPICKVVSAIYMVPLDVDTNALNPSSVSDLFSVHSTLYNTVKDTLAKIDYTDMLQTAESIIGSMSLDIKDTGSADTTRMNESESALSDKKSDAMTRISGARGAAFRVYNYNSDNTPKTTRSYIGTCEDKAFKSINPDMTCRESADAFIMYFKINDEFGYACGDATSYGMVNVEPKGFFCGGSVSAPPAPVIKKGTSVNGAYSHIGVSNIATISNCGILKYKDNTEQSGGIGASDCFNQAIKSCQPAVISGVVDGLISTYQVAGKESGKCILTQRFFKQVSNVETQSAFQKCVIDPAVGWPSLSGCVEAE